MTMLSPADASVTPESFAEDFARFLVDQSVLDRFTVDRASRAAQMTGERLDLVLTRLGLLGEAELGAALSRFLAMPLVDAASIPLVHRITNPRNLA